MLHFFRKSAARKALGLQLYGELIARSRALVFYREFGVPDTIDGRFDLVALHGWLALEHLKGEAAQGLVDAIFIGFDEAMREQGQGDMGLGRKMKQFADAWYGRLSAYSAAKNMPALAAALARNLYRGAATDDRAMTLAEYAIAAREYLRYAPDGTLDFGPLPSLGAP
jgi:cytochrome b pre-mRNA-processing protein 3